MPDAEDGGLSVPDLLIRVGVWERGGPEPGYQWTVLILQLAFEDAMRSLDESQHEHMIYQVQDLAMHHDPTHSQSLKLDKVGSFYELREKGGGLGKNVNVRVFYDLVAEDRVIRILGLDKKKKEGHISVPVKERILRRQSRWIAGQYPQVVTKRLDALKKMRESN